MVIDKLFRKLILLVTLLKGIGIFLIILPLIIDMWGYSETPKPVELEFIRTIPTEEQEDIFFKFPPVIAVDKDGYLYAFDPNSHHWVYKINRKGELVLTIGKQGAGPGDLYKPFLMSIRDNEMVIMDQFGFSIFDTNGRFIEKFKKFKDIMDFDVHKKKIYARINASQKLITVFDYKGKKLGEFGDIYKADLSIFKGQSREFLEGFMNSGRVMCMNDKIVYISKFFGDIKIFDYTGKCIGGYMLTIDESTVKSNKDYFFKNGEKTGGSLSATSVFYDSYIEGDRLYILNGGRKYFEVILEFNLKNMALQKEYIFYDRKNSKPIDCTARKLIVRNNREGLFFYVSIREMDEEWNSILSIYRKR